ncbi:MAG TPA: G1 family glutamic endopeptidase [Verrucomicrobiae bacterium]|nr:G1 family glutamic endopeptidase [Verrucomicrobiae bacterium]
MKLKALLFVGVIATVGLVATNIGQALRQLPTTYGSALGAASSFIPHVSTTSFIPTSSTDPTSTASTTGDVTENWAGYVSTGGTYTAISGSWNVPSVATGTNSEAADATWIGIGGDTSDDLIQIGTQNDVEDGQVTTGTFYERLPDASETIASVNVSAGDAVTASIKQVDPDEWSVSITDTTNGESFSNTVAYNSTNSSAEWIEEAPSDGNAIVPLDEFGSVAFTSGSTIENGTTLSIAGSKAQALTMVSSDGETLATTSALNSAGTGFTVTRTSADAVGTDQYEPIPTGWSRHEPGLGSYRGVGRDRGYSIGGGYITTSYYR